MVKNKLKTQLETKLSKLGFKKQINDGVCGEYDVMEISLNHSNPHKAGKCSLEVWYECNPDINDEKDFHYVITINDTDTMLCEDVITYKSEKGCLNWINEFISF
tara:strand:+ start:251 stop:562 length:312 start_codon:yes stop_codon:yes gene_type:complete